MQYQLSFKLTGYLIAPHEWLRIAAFKLLGKSYRYHLNNHRVVSSEPLTVRQQLFSLLLPFVAGLAATFSVAALWILSAWIGQYPRKLPDYLWLAPWWHHALHLTWLALLFYTVLFSCDDLLRAYYLLRKQKSPDDPKNASKDQTDWHPDQKNQP